MIVKGNSRYDYNCSSLRTIIAFLMIIVELKLVHLIGMKNAGGYLVCNLIERLIGSLSFGV